MSDCDLLRESVVDLGDAAFEGDEALATHRDSCAECAAFLVALRNVDESVAELPALEPADELIERTLHAVRTSVDPVDAPSPLASPLSRLRRLFEEVRWRNVARLGAAMTAVLLLLAVGVPNVLNLLQRYRQPRTMPEVRTVGSSTERYQVDNAFPPSGGPDAPETRDEVVGIESPNEASKQRAARRQAVGISIDGASGAENRYVIDNMDTTDAQTGHSGKRREPMPPATPQPDAAGSAEEVKVTASYPLIDVKSPAAAAVIDDNAVVDQAAQQRLRNASWQLDAVETYNYNVESKGKSGSLDDTAKRRQEKVGTKKDAAKESLSDREGAASAAGADRSRLRLEMAALLPTGRDHTSIVIPATRMPAETSDVSIPAPHMPSEAMVSNAEAQSLLHSMTWNDQLRYQGASGYWANTYVPGDPWIRLLESRLRKRDAPFIGPGGDPYQLDASARQYNQPFDAPRDAALAVYLHAYHRSDATPMRLLVQVGLQGTSRQSGLRPAMNVGVVLDLRGDVRTDVATSMRALVSALIDAKQVGDRFSVTVAGRPGGVVVPPEEFRHGRLALAMRGLFGERDVVDGTTLGLVDAMSSAMESVTRGDDPSTALGASAVLLVTPSRFSDDLEDLERLAHTSSVSGIPVSVVAVGGGVDLDEVDRLTLAGQGNRRLLGSPDEADSLIDRELHSVSRVVARAVRLRIRLKPGVKLIAMLGADRLDDGRAERVREAEESVDLRLARNLGIVSDRGEDEEGMQVVIPSYYAGDSHVILLDVVAERPGMIADVTVRFKDLVYLRNGVTRANLSVDRRRNVVGPLELNVLKNLVALRLSQAMEKAGDGLAAGDVALARTVMTEQVRLLEGLREEVGGWERDPELLHDARMLAEYVAVLDHGLDDGADRQALADSMQIAGRMKVQARRR